MTAIGGGLLDLEQVQVHPTGLADHKDLDPHLQVLGRRGSPLKSTITVGPGHGHGTRQQQQLARSPSQAARPSANPSLPLPRVPVLPALPPPRLAMSYRLNYNAQMENLESLNETDPERVKIICKAHVIKPIIKPVEEGDTSS
ncbi:hypothetical protein V8E36_008317 [Tilletia maclaganii]